MLVHTKPILNIQKIKYTYTKTPATFNLPIIYFNSSVYSTFFIDFKWIDYTHSKRMITGIKTLNQTSKIDIIISTLIPTVQTHDGFITYENPLNKRIDQNDTMQIAINMKQSTYQ